MLPIPNKATITAMNSSHWRLSFGDGWWLEFGELDELVIAIAHNLTKLSQQVYCDTDSGFWGGDRPKITPTVLFGKNVGCILISAQILRRSIIASDETYRGLVEEKFYLGKNTATGK